MTHRHLQLAEVGRIEPAPSAAGRSMHNVHIAMRDGINLSADVYLPADTTGRCTTVLTRTCYTKALHFHSEKAAFWNAHGFAYVVQDVRGRGDSDGTFYPLVAEEYDGSDTIDWIARQPWSDGRVVMVGASYLGWTQVYAALSRNPHLVALAVAMTPPDPDRSFPLSHGMIMPAAASWLATLDGRTNQDLSQDALNRAIWHHPIIDFDTVIGRSLPAWRDWTDHPTKDAYWDSIAYQQRLRSSTIPMLHVSGWYDDCLVGTLENYTALKEHNTQPERPRQVLVVGPWLHAPIGSRYVGKIDFGEAAELDLNRLHLAWFLSVLDPDRAALAPANVFVMGANKWLTLETWPPQTVVTKALYLGSVGEASSAASGGSLRWSAPGEEPPDHFMFDPSFPVPYADSFDWRQVGGPDDCSLTSARPDVLVYTSAPLEEKLLICGPLSVELFASTDARDTDWTAKIIDVRPDGSTVRLNDGAIRARFREGHETEIFIEPGSICKFAIECGATCIELDVGHRLRLEISSSVFGKYDVNLNGGGPIGRETYPIVARQTVYHDRKRPSCLSIPVLPS